MVPLVVAVAIIISVGAGGFILSEYLNRHKRLVDGLSRRVVAERLRQRSIVELKEVVGRLPGDGIQDTALKVVEGISRVLRVPPGTLRLDDRIRDLIRVHEADFDSDGASSWRKARTGGYYDAGIYEIADLLQQLMTVEAWGTTQADLKGGNGGNLEESWINLILPMSLEEVVGIIDGGDARGGSQIGS